MGDALTCSCPLAPMRTHPSPPFLSLYLLYLFYQYSTNILPIFSQYSHNILPILAPMRTHTSPPFRSFYLLYLFYHYFTNILSIFSQYFTNIGTNAHSHFPILSIFPTFSINIQPIFCQWFYQYSPNILPICYQNSFNIDTMRTHSSQPIISFILSFLPFFSFLILISDHIC